MTNLTQQVKHGAGQALATLSQGWRELRSRAGNALTHFQGRRADGDEGSDDGLPALGSWGFMAADVVNSKDQIVVRLEAPGLSRKDFNVELRGNVLCVRRKAPRARIESRRPARVSVRVRKFPSRYPVAGGGGCRSSEGNLSRRRPQDCPAEVRRRSA